MWEALITHDDRRWDAGAAVLADEVSLRKQDFAAYTAALDGGAGLDSHVIALGVRATTTVAWPARARVYGELLATCAGCHARWL